MTARREKRLGTGKTVLTGPARPPYERFIPAPVDFDRGLAIERTIHTIARSYREARWRDREAVAPSLWG